MSLDAAFQLATDGLLDPGMGMEQMGPLLYHLIRFVRPQCVLEVGAGYTTACLLRALGDNRAEFERDAADLLAKTRRYRDLRDETLSLEGDSTGAIDELRRLQQDWAPEAPPLADPAFYAREYRPVLFSLDDGSAREVIGERVRGAADRLGLADLLRFQQVDFRGFSRHLPADGLPLDLAWFDCGGHAEYKDFLEEYWRLIRPDGGLVVLHATVDNPFLGHVVKDLKLQQAGRPGDLELLSLAEPHKFHQFSFTIVRRTSACRDDFERAARAFAYLNEAGPGDTRSEAASGRVP